MPSYYLALLPALALALVGCASSTIKPIYTGRDLISIAEIDYFSEKCSRQGRMALETAAYGKRIVSEVMQNYQVDMREFEQNKAHINSFNAGNQELCNQVSLMILNIKGKDDAKKSSDSASQAMPQIPFMPTNTRCNTAFGQTFCTSY
jgi:hypothetical protein